MKKVCYNWKVLPPKSTKQSHGSFLSPWDGKQDRHILETAHLKKSFKNFDHFDSEQTFDTNHVGFRARFKIFILTNYCILFIWKYNYFPVLQFNLIDLICLTFFVIYLLAKSHSTVHGGGNVLSGDKGSATARRQKSDHPFCEMNKKRYQGKGLFIYYYVYNSCTRGRRVVQPPSRR